MQFAADLDSLKSAGVIIQRYNLSQNPGAFVENELVRTTLAEKGETALATCVGERQGGGNGTLSRIVNELAALVKVKVKTASASSQSSCGCGGTC